MTIQRVCSRCGSLPAFCDCPPADARPSSAKRGYGRAHQELRKTWALKVDAGGVLCARCGDPIEPGSDWDLGHVDGDRSRYSGPEHSSCNRATSTHRAGRA